ncbi:MAG: two-component regulator propeller domain-containing protein, partial [Chitinophagaceae bacterium]
MTPLRLFFCICLLVAFSLVRAQSSPLFFEGVSVQNGLSNNKVNCVLQDKRGFIWIGTNDGLNRYDGHNFIIFRSIPGDTTSISGNTINDLLEDKDGVIWIATSDGGLTRYDYRLEPGQQFKQYKHLPADKRSIPVNIVSAMAEDKYGNLWMATNGAAVVRMDKKTGRFDIPIPDGPRVVLDVSVDKDGIIWAGRQGGGIVRIDPVTLQYSFDNRYKNLYAKLPHMEVSSLYTDKENNTWYGSWDKVLYKYDHHTAREIVYQNDQSPYPFTNDEVISFAEDRQGNLWLGGKTTGLQILNKTTGAFLNYRHNPLHEGSLIDNSVNCIYIDREGDVWLGTDKGLSICRPTQQRFTQHFLLPSRDLSATVTVYDFFSDENKDLWIGTSEGIFLRKNNQAEMIHRPVIYKGNKLIVTKFFRDRQGNFYIGTNYSLFRYDKERNTVQLLPNTEKDSVMNKIIESRVVSIVEDVIDNDPVLLVSPYGHYLTYYDLTTQKWVSRLDTARKIIEQFNIKDNLIPKLFRTSTGKIWMATTREGLGEWKTTHGGTVFYSNDPVGNQGLSNNHVSDITEDRLGNLWVSTYGGGLNYVEMKGRKIKHINATNNLLEGIATDKKGNVWMISNSNLQKYDILAGSSKTYTLPDLEKTGGVKGYIYKDQEGTMYLGGNNYFISFHPDSIQDKITEPLVRITDFKIFNNSFSHLLNDNTIHLSYRQNYFTFEFSAPDYSSPQPVQYQYMLENFDKEWIDIGTRNSAIFSNLPGGDYTFRIRATNNPGNWREMEQRIRIIITPPFWKRWWFYVICVVFISVAIYVFYRYRINELLKRQAIRNKI